MAIGTCDSCGDEGEAVTAVQREYVTPPASDTEAKVVVVEEPEHWCVVCRTHYPHRLIEA